MKDPLSKVKTAMSDHTFKNLTFSKERKQGVKEAIREKKRHAGLASWSEETLISLLQSVKTEARDGYAISVILFQRHDRTFERKEGELYTLLHMLENKEILSASWKNDRKYYALTGKGKKYLAASQEKSTVQSPVLRKLIEEAAL
ncbi:PadR family transcriptional regulator [Alteribacter natronophilus]|uniref:PadR family transcriptional regulator n=1 Tax=Alteribacter natronophilus TaxID=2583810 RepID=UPI00110EDC54|nr:PadR family transcriptional regulator [Alteribacter natronophilus]TMW72827.1 PadR family transcriptional regulator [Alteribacter natronophilus]